MTSGQNNILSDPILSDHISFVKLLAWVFLSFHWVFWPNEMTKRPIDEKQFLGPQERPRRQKAFCYQKLFWPFTVWINCSSDLKIFANSQPSASNFTSFSQSLDQFFLTVGQNNVGNKIPVIVVVQKLKCDCKNFLT